MAIALKLLHERKIYHRDLKSANVFLTRDGSSKLGDLNVSNGKINENLTVEGKSLVSSAELTAKAFSQGTFGEYGGKLVAIALLLFAFSTAITWCYYGCLLYTSDAADE